MGSLILGINSVYMLSCFLKQFALVGKGLKGCYDSTKHVYCTTRVCALYALIAALCLLQTPVHFISCHNASVSSLSFSVGFITRVGHAFTFQEICTVRIVVICNVGITI